MADIPSYSAEKTPMDVALAPPLDQDVVIAGADLTDQGFSAARIAPEAHISMQDALSADDASDVTSWQPVGCEWALLLAAAALVLTGWACGTLLQTREGENERTKAEDSESSRFTIGTHRNGRQRL